MRWATAQRRCWEVRREERVEERSRNEKRDVGVAPHSGQSSHLESTGQLGWAGGEARSRSIALFKEPPMTSSKRLCFNLNGNTPLRW